MVCSNTCRLGPTAEGRFKRSGELPCSFFMTTRSPRCSHPEGCVRHFARGNELRCPIGARCNYQADSDQDYKFELQEIIAILIFPTRITFDLPVMDVYSASLLLRHFGNDSEISGAARSHRNRKSGDRLFSVGYRTPNRRDVGASLALAYLK